MGIIARAIKTASGTINFLAGSKAKASEVNTDLNTIVTAFNGNIDNDNIAADAAIAGSKLAVITETGKLSGVAFTNLAGIPSGAGVIPSANLPEVEINLTTDVVGILPIANGGTSASTAQAAIDALLPSQDGNSGKYLTTNATNASWGSIVSNFTSFKAGTFNRAIADASGDVSYTGVGFVPKAIIFFTSFAPVTNTAAAQLFGADGGDSGSRVGTVNQSGVVTFVNSTTYSINIIGGWGSYTQSGFVKSFDADGFTITWARAGSTGTATIPILYFAIK